MNLLMLSALAAQSLAANPPLTGSTGPLAPSNPQVGQTPVGNLTRQEWLKLIALDRWLRSQDGIRSSETKQQCIERLVSKTPTKLEQALLDLKCSQRP